MFIYFIPVIFALLLLAHLYLGLVFVTRSVHLNSLNGSWKKLDKQRKAVEEFRQQYDVLSQDARMIQRLNAQKINWPEKLNRLSLDLAPGIWFSEVTFKKENFILRGSAVSLQKEEVGAINKFLDNLKKDARFFKGFTRLEMGALNRRTIGAYDIVDFVFSGDVKL